MYISTSEIGKRANIEKFVDPGTNWRYTKWEIGYSIADRTKGEIG